jgi:hypothetical protein
VEIQTNPLCACGCGQEVARPWNRFIFGHSQQKLGSNDIVFAKCLLMAGIAQHRIADLLGVSQGTICSIRFGMLDRRIVSQGRYTAPGARAVLRPEDIAEMERRTGEARNIREAKRMMTDLKKTIAGMRRATR